MKSSHLTCLTRKCSLLSCPCENTQSTYQKRQTHVPELSPWPSQNAEQVPLREPTASEPGCALQSLNKMAPGGQQRRREESGRGNGEDEAQTHGSPVPAGRFYWLLRCSRAQITPTQNHLEESHRALVSSSEHVQGRCSCTRLTPL